MTQIPLFPLGTVLLPGQVLPLHIFEPRYRTLVNDLMASDDPEGPRFGVVAIQVGREVGVDGVAALHGVGCTAEVRSVQAHDDGRFDLVTAGGRRFRLDGVVDAERPYLMGEVTWLPEERGEIPDALVGDVTDLYEQYRAMLGLADDVADPGDVDALAYRVAAGTVLTSADRQALLAAPDVAHRLRTERKLLRRELALWEHLPSLPDTEAAQQPIGLN